MAVQTFEPLPAFRQHIDLVPGPELVGGAVMPVTPDRRRKDRGVAGVIFRPVLQMRQREKIGVGIFVRLEIAPDVAAALPAHRCAPAWQRIPLQVVHTGADRTTQLVIIVGVLFFVHEAPARSAADDGEIFWRMNRPVLAESFSVQLLVQRQHMWRLEFVTRRDDQPVTHRAVISAIRCRVEGDIAAYRPADRKVEPKQALLPIARNTQDFPPTPESARQPSRILPPSFSGLVARPLRKPILVDPVGGYDVRGGAVKRAGSRMLVAVRTIWMIG